MRSATTSLRIRTLALPNEHGGWAFLGVPLLGGLLLAPSGAGGWLALAGLAAFLVRHPLRLALQDWQRRRTYPRTRIVWVLVAGYTGVALLALLAAVLTSSNPFWQPALLAAPVAGLHLWWSIRPTARSLPAELSGALALAVLGAMLVLAGGGSSLLAGQLWLLCSLWAALSIVYVRSRLQHLHGAIVSLQPLVLAHLAAGGLVLLLGLLHLLPLSALLIPALLGGRAWYGMQPQRIAAPAYVIGIQESVLAVLLVALFAVLLAAI